MWLESLTSCSHFCISSSTRRHWVTNLILCSSLTLTLKVFFYFFFTQTHRHMTHGLWATCLQLSLFLLLLFFSPKKLYIKLYRTKTNQQKTNKQTKQKGSHCYCSYHNLSLGGSITPKLSKSWRIWISQKSSVSGHFFISLKLTFKKKIRL